MQKALFIKKHEISSLSEQVDLLRRDLMSCIIMLNNQNGKQAEVHFEDTKKRMRALNEQFSDLCRSMEES